MTEEVKGQGSQGTQQTQGNGGLTAEEQKLKDWTKSKLQEQGILPGINQGTQTATTTTALPGITKLQNLQKSNKIQLGNDGNNNLPGIITKRAPTATISEDTSSPTLSQRIYNLRNIDEKRSINEQLHDEMLGNEYSQLFKQGVKQTWNDIKKYGYRKGVEIVDDIANHPYETILGRMPHLKLLGKYLDNNITNNLDTKPLVDKSMNILWNKYYKYEDKINKDFEKWVDQNMNKILAKEYQDSGGVWESIKSGDTDNIKYGLMQGFSSSVIPMIPGIIAGFVTKNPTVTASIAFASTAPIEDQEAYEEAMKEGATRDEATQIGRYAGIINGALETIGEFLQLKGMLKPLKKNITKEITKKTTRQIIGRGLWERNKGIFGEALTEGTQELVTNALIKTVNEDKDIWENVIDSIVVGGTLGAGGSTLGAGGKVIEDVENNKKIDLATDIEAMNYVIEGEERKAQRMQQKGAEQREKIKQKILSRRNANTWGDVEEIDNQNMGESEEQQTGQEFEESQIEDEMIDEVLNDEDENENMGDSKYQKNGDTVRSSDQQEAEGLRIDSSSNKGRVTITNENASEFSKKLDEIKNELEGLKADTFLERIKNAISGNQNTNYIINKNTDRKYVLRISSHHANAYNARGNKAGTTSIVIKLMEAPKFKKDNKVNLTEFVYDPANMTTEKMQGIIDGIENWISTGQYTDTKFDSKNESTKKKGENKQSSTGEKHQLKYEEKGYTPGVANKNEKDISGKEGIKQKNTINDETIEQLAEKYGVKVEVIKGMIEILRKGKREGYAYGKYRDQLLTLSEQIKESTAPHELLHAIFDMIDPETKVYLISQVMKSEGWNAETAEERLADSFSNFFRTGKIEGAPKSTWGRIKIFFKKVRSFINGMNKWRNELEEIFTDIITADGIVDLQSKIDESSSLNKSKERMRKRFMEYRKNAEKIQSSKAPKDWSKKDASYQIADESVYELQPLERIEQMEQNILDEYGETDNPGRVAFVDNKGRWINGNMGGYGNYRDVDHREIAQTAFDDTDIEFNNGTDELVALQAQTGLVRVNYNDGYMNIDTVYELMPSQREGLMKFADENIEEVNVDITDQKTGRTVKSDTFMNVRDAVRWIDRHFAESENKYQKAGDINSEAFKKRFGDSKVVDKDGNPLVVYHGTRYDIKIPNMKKGRRQAYGGGMYFTTNKQGAEHYANEKKNLLSFLRKPRVMEVYLSIQNPIKEGVYKWDNKWIDELKKLGYEVNEEYLSRKNVDIFDKYFHLRMLQDKKKAINFTEDFSKVTGYDGLVAPQSGGEEYWVAFKPSQVKSATDNVGTYDANNDDIRYQKADDDNKMIALHNISLEKLEKAKDLGGLVAPSVAITKSGIPFENYGEISFIGNKQLVNPSKDVLVGETDLYTPRVPQPTLEWKDEVTREQQEKIAEKLGMKMGELYDYVTGYSQNFWERQYPNLAKEIAPYINKTLFKGFTEMGDRIYEPYTMKNILKEMFSEGDVGAESAMFQGNLSEAMARLSEDVKDLENVREKINTREGLNEKYDELSDKYTDLGWDILEGREGLAIFSENIKRSNAEIVDELADYDIEVTEEQIQELKDIVIEALKLPKSYVEAKIKRGVGFDEFSAVVVPEDEVEKVRDIIGDGIEIYGYKPGERMKVINEIADEKDVKFQRADSDQKDNDGRILSNGQAEYFKDSKVRDDNGNLLRVYHGTKQPEEFTVFDNSKSNGYNSNSSAHIGNRFTDSKKGAENFAETTWAQGKPRAMEGYLNIKNPKIYETRDVTKEKAKAGENNKKLIKDMEDRLNVLGFNTKLGGYESLTGMPSLRYNDKEFMKMMGYLTSEAMVNDYKGWGGYSKLGDFVNALSKAGISDAQIVNEAKYLHNLYNDYMDSEKKYYSIQSDAYDQYQSDISRYGDNARDAVSEYKQDLIKQGYDGIIIKNTEYDGGEFGGTNTQYVSFNSNQFKNIDNLNPTDNEDIRYQRVYHGSPAEFDKFDSSHMGEGEGAQAHGWGHYVAVEERTGRHYAEIRPQEWAYKGVKSSDIAKKIIDSKFDGVDYLEGNVNAILNKMQDGMNFQEAKKQTIDDYKDLRDLYEENEQYEDLNKINKEIDFLKKVKETDISKEKRNLYEVEIPDPVKADTPTGSNYLEEGGKLSLDEFNKIIDKLYNIDYKATKIALEIFNSKEAFLLDGRNVYKLLSEAFGSDKEASKFLESLGYDGIHYFGGRDGEAYVIFNDNALEIRNHEKFQIAGDIESEAFKKRFGDSKVVDENGNPLRVYHGSPDTFNIFDKNKIGGNAQKVGPGFYFTDIKKEADAYKKRVDILTGKYYNATSDNPRTIEAYLSIKNPIRIGEDTLSKDDMMEIILRGDYEWAFDNWLPTQIESINDLNIKKINGKWYTPEQVRSMSKEEKVELYVDRIIERSRGYKDDLMLDFLEEVSSFYHYNNRGRVLDVLMEVTGNDGVIYEKKGWNPDRKYPVQYVAWSANEIKSATDNVGTYDPNNEDIRYQVTEYEYDENGKPKWIKFGDNSEFDPSIFGENTKEEQIEEDKENEKSNPFYNAWMKYNNQNYKDDQLTLGEFVDAVGAWGEKKQEEFDKRQNDILEVENDPKMLELQLKAVKLAEEETNVGKKFGKNVSKEVRDRQQAEVETKREDLSKEIFEWMYPGLEFEDATYDDTNSAWNKEAEWEMLGREKIEEKLKYFKKDKNGNWEKKNIKLETPQEQREKIEKSGNFDEVIEPKDRVIQWETPEGQKGRLDKAKDPKQFKKVMEKINSGKSKTKVELKDVTNEVRALERYKENEKAEKERRKKEKQEEYAKKKQEEYKRNVRMKAFQRLVDMQRFEKFPFLSEEEIKQRWGFTDEEWKKITEQLDIGYPPKKRNEKAVSDFNKAVDSEVKFIIEGLSRQNKMKQKEAEKNLGEIGEIDLDVLLGKDEEKGQKEVEEFERIAKEEKKKSKKEKNKRLEQAREDVTQVEIDKERENSKSEKERVDKIIKSTKSDNTVWGSIKKTASDILTPVSTRIREISPKIYRELMRYFQNKDILTNQRLKEIDPFLKAMGKIRKENPVRFMDIWVALANRNIGYANGLLQEYGVKVPTQLLDTIFDEAEDVGLNINYLGSYYPLSVKAPKSFLEELMKVGNGDIASEIEKKIQEESVKKGGPLDESEVTAIINSVIAGEEKGPDVNLGNKHMKKRNTEIERTPKMLEYCDDPISTLIGYIEGMTQSIERAKFLGKSRSGNVHTLADYVYNVKNGLDPTQQDELMELLKSVFNDASPNKFYQTWRDIATLTTLGSPSSTLTQIGDLSFSIYENGWREALKAVWDIFMKRKAFDLKDMGVINRGEEYTNINSQKNLLQKAIHNVFKLTFFSKFDTFGKSTFIQSTWNKRRKRALKGENGDPQLIKDIMKITDDEYLTYKIINDLRNGVFSEEVALVMYMKLGNIQPLTKAQMPKAYLDNPNGRLFYQFKTFGIKQLDYVLQETKEQTRGFKNLSTTEKFLRVAQVASMIFIMTLMGAGASELKDITMRRRSNSLILRWLFGEEVGSEQIWDKIGDSALQLFGLSRYTVMQMKSDPVDAITNLFTTFPATNLIMYPFKDINKAFKDDGSINWRNPSSYQLIPVIGKYRYWIYGGGQDKQQEALDKEKKTTTSGGSSRTTRTTRKTNRNTRSTR